MLDTGLCDFAGHVARNLSHFHQTPALNDQPGHIRAGRHKAAFFQWLNMKPNCCFRHKQALIAQYEHTIAAALIQLKAILPRERASVTKLCLPPIRNYSPTFRFHERKIIDTSSNLQVGE